MTKLRAHNISMSIDGFMAGPDQTLDDPLGVRGEELHTWLFADDIADVDKDYFRQGTDGIGATIMGRNMFGPVRGEWPDESWRGWWGDDPPYHHPVFVLTHHPRAPIPMEGGTTFHFVTDGIEAALSAATEAAGGADIRLGGGASTIRQYAQAGLLDELHVVVVPIVLGGGERVFDGPLDGFECVEFAASDAVAHARFARRQ